MLTICGMVLVIPKIWQSANSLATLDPGPHSEHIYPSYVSSVGTSSDNRLGMTLRDMSMCELAHLPFGQARTSRSWSRHRQLAPSEINVLTLQARTS